MPISAPREVPPQEEEKKGENFVHEQNSPPPSKKNDEGFTSEKGAEPTPTDDQPANDSHGDQVDAMDVDHDHEVDCEDHDQEGV